MPLVRMTYEHVHAASRVCVTATRMQAKYAHRGPSPQPIEPITPDDIYMQDP
jgi:hypothetical protein